MLINSVGGVEFLQEDADDPESRAQMVQVSERARSMINIY